MCRQTLLFIVIANCAITHSSVNQMSCDFLIVDDADSDGLPCSVYALRERQRYSDLRLVAFLNVQVSVEQINRFFVNL